MVFTGQYKGFKAVIMDSRHLQVIVLPELGGKIPSLKDKETGVELFFQREMDEFAIPEPCDSFLNYDVSGFDEMFPTIDPCLYPVKGYYEGRMMPDHGEVWYLPWEVRIQSHEVRLSVVGQVLPYTMEKRLSFKDSRTLRIDYSLTNRGVEKISYIWAMHGLIQCDPSMEIILPENVNKVVNVFQSTVLGEPGKIHSYPITQDMEGNLYRLDRVQPESAKKVEKWYVSEKMTQGQVGAFYPTTGYLYQLKYPAERIPYLGFYVTEGGGGRGDDYNCALEPCTGYYDSLELAWKNNKVSVISPGNTEEWYLEIYWGPKSMRE